MWDMFKECKSLKAKKIITKDKEILKSFSIDNDKDNDRCFII